MQGLARADDAPAKIEAAQSDAFKQRLFGSAAGQKAYACFTRRYDAEHLARHPHQKVASMKLLVKFEADEQPHAIPYSFKLGLKYRHRKEALETAGTCALMLDEATGKEIQIGCSVDCDGGGLGIAFAKDRDAMVLKLERVRVWPSGKEPEENSEDLSAGIDDKSFRLDRADLSDCAGLVEDKDERLALNRK
ncbi:hypothetical protein RPMA_08575 [Tardiphaga alba]|uniref:Uncharacterized protein n=2 Tax=Tardiphaga alba TaxID=340268 RepID=A0ABX8AF13_9BRAD|nr:hypothetical protein RPMA_08575 [Tardiphaga alba]